MPPKPSYVTLLWGMVITFLPDREGMLQLRPEETIFGQRPLQSAVAQVHPR